MKKINPLKACENGLIWLLTRKSAGEKGPGEGFCRVTFQGSGLTPDDRAGLIAAFARAGDEYFSNKLLAEIDPEPTNEEAETAIVEVREILKKMGIDASQGNSMEKVTEHKRLVLTPLLGGLAGYVLALVALVVPFAKHRQPWLNKNKGRS